jgi:nitronate monooxygenase
MAAGATAAALGTAFLRCPEAGTSPVHREALTSGRPTRLTQAFSGRLARGIVNDFMQRHDGHAVTAYPEVHHVTAPTRAAAREAGDPDWVNLWAGQAYPLSRAEPATEVVGRLVAELDAVRR